jgi:hypothetical protein
MPTAYVLTQSIISRSINNSLRHQTYQYLNEVADYAAFAWHGGDISYADDWFDGILACESGEVCYNGSESYLYNTPPAPFPEDYSAFSHLRNLSWYIQDADLRS